MASASQPHSHVVAPGRASATRHWLRHLIEMIVAMYVGMMVFGGLLGIVLIAAGTSFSEASETAPAAMALALMFNMTVPMLAWMRHRGHERARIVEMAIAMAGVAAVTLALLWASAIENTAVCGVECTLMIVATVGVMTVRRREYARPV